MDLPDLARIARELPRDELPRLVGQLAEAEAVARLRLAEASTAPPATTCRTIDGDEGATIAGASKRWLLKETAGMRFRVDLSRKRPRFLEDGLRAWLATRRS
jgi:hypothetical protein